MDDNADETDIINTGDCDYYDLSVPLTVKFTNSIFHLNVRSLASKVCDIEGLINITGIPKVFMLSETWLSVNSHMLNIDNYSFISSPRCTGRGGGGHGLWCPGGGLPPRRSRGAGAGGAEWRLGPRR